MDKVEAQEIAGFLLECHEALCEWDGTGTMTLYLHRLYEVIHQIENATPSKGARDVRFALVLAAKKARRLRRQIEGRRLRKGAERQSGGARRERRRTRAGRRVTGSRAGLLDGLRAGFRGPEQDERHAQCAAEP